MAWLRLGALRRRPSLAVLACMGAVIAPLAGGALPAAGETGPANDSPGSECATPDAPTASTRVTRLTAGIGATQSTVAGTRFALRLAVTVTNSRQSPVPGVLVTFAAPNRGPSGYFTVRSGGARRSASRMSPQHTSRERRVRVRSDACGVALAPPFTADDRHGGYIVVASAAHVRTAFALVNEGP